MEDIIKLNLTSEELLISEFLNLQYDSAPSTAGFRDDFRNLPILDDSDVFMAGETQVPFLWNVKIWELAGAFLIVSVVLSKLNLK